jgi:hypothetical protein
MVVIEPGPPHRMPIFIQTDTISSLDYSSPALTDEEKKFAVVNGYVCTENPRRFYYQGMEIGEAAFMKAIGLGDYADQLTAFKKRNAAWSWAMLATSLGTAVLLPYAMPNGSGNYVMPIACASFGLGFVVSTTGAVINSSTRPSRLDFRAIAYRANDLNRELMKKGGDSAASSSR